MIDFKKFTPKFTPLGGHQIPQNFKLQYFGHATDKIKKSAKPLKIKVFGLFVFSHWPDSDRLPHHYEELYKMPILPVKSIPFGIEQKVYTKFTPP